MKYTILYCSKFKKLSITFDLKTYYHQISKLTLRVTRSFVISSITVPVPLIVGTSVKNGSSLYFAYSGRSNFLSASVISFLIVDINSSARKMYY